MSSEFDHDPTPLRPDSDSEATNPGSQEDNVAPTHEKASTETARLSVEAAVNNVLTPVVTRAGSVQAETTSSRGGTAVDVEAVSAKRSGAADPSAIAAGEAGTENSDVTRVEAGLRDGEPIGVGESFVRPRGSKSARIGGQELPSK